MLFLFFYFRLVYYIFGYLDKTIGFLCLLVFNVVVSLCFLCFRFHSEPEELVKGTREFREREKENDEKMSTFQHKTKIYH